MIVFFLLGRKAQSFELFLWVETQTLKCQCRIRGEFVFQESWGLHSMRNHLRKVTGQRWRSAGKRSTAKDCAAIQLNFRTLKSWRRGGRRRRRGLPCWRSEFFLGNLSTSCCRRRSSRWLSLASSWVSTRPGRPSPSTYNAFFRWKYKRSKSVYICLFTRPFFCRDCLTLTTSLGTQAKSTWCSSFSRRWGKCSEVSSWSNSSNAWQAIVGQ